MRDISSANRAVWRRDSLQIGAAFGGWGTSPVMEESKVDGERARPKRLGTRQATGWVGLAVSCRTTYLDLVEIFQRFVAGRKARVERALRLDTRLDVVGQAMTSLAQHIAERGDDRVPYEAAHQLVNASRPTCANRQTP